MLINLVVNALKFSPEHSLVEISASRGGDEVVTSVKDRGAGISPGELPYIFDKYRRGSFGKAGGGTGLGLFIVKSIIDAHGGRIWVDSIEGQGSVFHFGLPVLEEEL